jgi:hypothetical protein
MILPKGGCGGKKNKKESLDGTLWTSSRRELMPETV